MGPGGCSVAYPAIQSAPPVVLGAENLYLDEEHDLPLLARNEFRAQNGGLLRGNEEGGLDGVDVGRWLPLEIQGKLETVVRARIDLGLRHCRLVQRRGEASILCNFHLSHDALRREEMRARQHLDVSICGELAKALFPEGRDPVERGTA